MMMARTYRRDSRGRFASGGGGGQTGGRGARLMGGGKVRRGGGAKTRAAPGFRKGVIAKGGNGVRGSVARSLAAMKREKPPAAKRARPGRSVEARIQRSSLVLLAYRRHGQHAGSVTGRRNMNPERMMREGRRIQAQKQALANLYERQSPAGKKRAMRALKRTRVMNG